MLSSFPLPSYTLEFGIGLLLDWLQTMATYLNYTWGRVKNCIDAIPKGNSAKLTPSHLELLASGADCVEHEHSVLCY